MAEEAADYDYSYDAAAAEPESAAASLDSGTSATSGVSRTEAAESDRERPEERRRNLHGVPVQHVRGLRRQPVRGPV